MTLTQTSPENCAPLIWTADLTHSLNGSGFNGFYVNGSGSTCQTQGPLQGHRVIVSMDLCHYNRDSD